MNFGCAGRACSHRSIASPTIRIDRLGERGRGLAGRHVEQTHPLAVPLGLLLPTDRANAQPKDLVGPQPGEQPHQRGRANELERIPRRAGSAAIGVQREIVAGQVQAGPHQLRPHVIGDHARLGSDQRGDRPGQPERAPGVEPALDPLPLLDVIEESARRPDQMRLRARQQLSAGPAAHIAGVRAVRVLADEHPVHARDPRRGELPRPGSRVGVVGLLVVDPAAELDQREVRLRAARARQRRGLKPPLRVIQPPLRNVQVAGAAASEPLVACQPGRERQRTEHAHVNHGSREPLNTGATRVVARAIPNRWQQLGPLREIVEHRAAGGEHQLIERALQVRAPQLRRVPERVQVRLDPANRLLNGRVAEHAPTEQPHLEPADLPVQIIDPAQLEGDRDQQLANIDVPRSDRPPPLHAIPTPERHPLPADRLKQIPAGRRPGPRPGLQAGNREHIVDRRDEPRQRLRDAGRPPPRTISDQGKRAPLLPTQRDTAVIGGGREQRGPPHLGRRHGGGNRGHESTSPISAIRSAWICVIPR